MSLYNKYRPNSFEEVVGNKETIQILLGQLDKKKDRPHTYLFHGPTGCGKTTLARILARELGCEGNDFREVDSADFRGIDTIREIRRQSAYRPMEGKCRAWLLDECHKLSNDAQNALLKALEDTPEHVYFLLCTTEPGKLLKTIRGRCTECQVERLNELQMKKLLRRIVKAEDEQLDKEVYEQIILDAQGHARNAIQILDKTLSVDPEDRLSVAKRAAEKQSQTIELCRALLQGSPWKLVRGILDGLKNEDPEGVRRAVIGYCATILLKDENDRAGVIMEEFSQPFYDNGFPGLVFACYSALKDEIPF